MGVSHLMSCGSDTLVNERLRGIVNVGMSSLGSVKMLRSYGSWAGDLLTALLSSLCKSDAEPALALGCAFP